MEAKTLLKIQRKFREITAISEKVERQIDGLDSGLGFDVKTSLTDIKNIGLDGENEIDQLLDEFVAAT